MLDIQKNVKLSDYTTFKIGGPAKEFVAVKNEDELIEALQYAKKNNLKYYILGGGSNVFFDDRGFDGLIIKTESNNSLELLADQQIECWAGENLASVVNFARDNDLSGLEDLAGIYGQFGGAIRGNAGAFNIELKDIIVNVKVLDVSGGAYEIKNFNNAQCEFGYRTSIFKKNPHLIVISAIVKLKDGEKNKIAERIKEIIQKRNEKQPTGWFGSAGSFFENPKVVDKKIIEGFEKDTGLRSNNGEIPAWWLVSEVGLAGKKIGGIQVSEKHSNFVLNNGGGTAEEVIMLASIIKQKVRTQLGIQLQEEVNYVGY